MTAHSTGLKKESLRFPDWQFPVLEALQEKDSADKQRLKTLVMAAETAIFNRQQALSRNGDSRDEQQAIQDAAALLRRLKTEALDFPDWNE